jgi:hypothetical protein
MSIFSGVSYYTILFELSIHGNINDKPLTLRNCDIRDKLANILDLYTGSHLTLEGVTNFTNDDYKSLGEWNGPKLTIILATTLHVHSVHSLSKYKGILTLGGFNRTLQYLWNTKNVDIFSTFNASRIIYLALFITMRDCINLAYYKRELSLLTSSKVEPDGPVYIMLYLDKNHKSSVRDYKVFRTVLCEEFENSLTRVCDESKRVDPINMSDNAIRRKYRVIHANLRKIYEQCPGKMAPKSKLTKKTNLPNKVQLF